MKSNYQKLMDGDLAFHKVCVTLTMEGDSGYTSDGHSTLGWSCYDIIHAMNDLLKVYTRVESQSREWSRERFQSARNYFQHYIKYVLTGEASQVEGVVKSMAERFDIRSFSLKVLN